MRGINIKKSEDIQVLRIKIQCDVCWNRYILIYPFILLTKENCLQLSCVGRRLNVYFDVNDGRVTKAIDSLEYRYNYVCKDKL